MLKSAVQADSASHSVFDDILSMSRNMLSDASMGNWEQLIETQSQRQHLIQDFFSKSVSSADAETVANGIREMLDIDKNIIRQSKQAMTGLSADMQKINHGAKARQAYAINM